MKAEKQYDIFLSYRRIGGIDTARTFYDRLSAMGYRVSFDIETLRNGKFNEQLYQRIDECKDVIVVLNRTALDLREDPDDDWLRLEVAYAIKKGKNIIPVFLRDYESPKPGALPPDIADLVEFQGVTASDEHFDSTLNRICDLLQSRPHRPWAVKFMVAAAVISLLGVGMTCWFCRDSIFPYPVTQRDKQRVGNLVGYMMMLGSAYDELLQTEQGLAESARTAILTGNVADFNQSAKLFEHSVNNSRRQFDNANALLPKVMSDIESMPIDSAGFPIFVESVRQDFELVGEFVESLSKLVDPKNVMSKDDRLKVVKINVDSIGYHGQIFAYSVMGVFCNISESSLGDIKKASLQWKILNKELARTWLRDEKEIERVGEAICNEYHGKMTELATITGNANVGLAEDRVQLRKMLIEQGATPEQADQAIDRMISPDAQKKQDEFLKGLGMPDLPTPKTPEELRENLKKLGATPEQIENMVSKMEKLQEMKGQLADAKKGIDEAKARARVKFAPNSMDDVGLLWGKTLRFLSLDMKDEALNAVHVIRKKGSSEFPQEACTAAEAFISARGRLPFVSGVMVTGIEPPAEEHAIFKMGDIIIEQDGKAVYGFKDYHAKEGSSYLVYRYDGQGNFRQLTLKMPPKQPRVAIVDLMEQAD